MRSALFLSPVAALFVAACTPMPNSGFDPAAPTLPNAAAVSDAPLEDNSEGADVAAQTAALLGLDTGDAATTTPPTTTGAPLNAMSSDSAINDGSTTVETPPTVRPSGISDEQNFEAVSSRESIASDAARLAENRAQYVVIQPGELPQRESGNGASVVKFALATNNAVGQQLYSRSSFNAEARFQRNCARYSHSDQAQEAFLNAGGPTRDPKGLDPDGDGFACYWDPAPFRAARNAAPQVASDS